MVFYASKSSEAERERMESQERNERVCGEWPTQMLINFMSSSTLLRIYALALLSFNVLSGF
jgi:hypothetical protein